MQYGGSPLIAFEAKTRHASDRIVDGGVRCIKRFTYRPLRKELPNLMISGMQHVLLVSIIYLHIILLNKV